MGIRKLNEVEKSRLNFLQSSGIEYCLLSPTNTGFEKSIMDATESVRKHFKYSGLHNYEGQALGAKRNGKLVPIIYFQPSGQVLEEGNLYRPKSRGRPIIRMSGIKGFAKPLDILALHSSGNSIVVINISLVDPGEILRNSAFGSLREVFRVSSDSAIRGSVDSAAASLDSSGAFNPDDESDGRDFELRAIAIRRGQPKFRRALLAEYDGQCVITGTACEPVLEAAHILPYKGKKTNHVSNGLLLRSDVHTLFDSFLIAVDSSEMKVIIADVLEDTEYAKLRHVVLRESKTKKSRPNLYALDWHRAKSGL